MSGRARDPQDRARLMLRLGSAVDPSIPRLRAHCFEAAIDALGDAAVSAAEGQGQRSVALLTAEALCLAGASWAELRDDEGAEERLQAALNTLRDRSGVEARALG